MCTLVAINYNCFNRGEFYAVKKNIAVKIFFITLFIFSVIINRQIVAASCSNLEIENYVQEFMSDNKIPGMAVYAIKCDQEILSKGFGFEDEDRPVTCQTLFEIGSNSKAFTAFAISKLADEKMLNLNDDISKYISWLDVYYKGEKQQLTIKNLIEHKSGIPKGMISKIQISSSKSALEDTVRVLKGINLKTAPGTKFEYSTINYDVLGLVIQNISGMPYEDYMEANIFKPLGLDETYAGRNVAPKNLVSNGYKLNFCNQKDYLAPIYRGNTPAGYIISNINDIGKWLKAQMNLLKDKNFQDENYFFGWFLEKEPTIKFMHRGINPNFSSFIMFDTDKDIGVAILCNTNNCLLDDFAKGIFSMVDTNDLLDKTQRKDFNFILDEICSSIYVVLSFSLLVIVFFMLKIIFQICKKERRFSAFSLKIFYKILFKLSILGLAAFAVYLIPYLFFQATWDFLFVWFPYTFKHVIIILFLNFVFLSILLIISSLFKREKQLNNFKMST